MDESEKKNYKCGAKCLSIFVVANFKMMKINEISPLNFI